MIDTVNHLDCSDIITLSQNQTGYKTSFAKILDYEETKETNKFIIDNTNVLKNVHNSCFLLNYGVWVRRPVLP